MKQLWRSLFGKKNRQTETCHVCGAHITVWNLPIRIFLWMMNLSGGRCISCGGWTCWRCLDYPQISLFKPSTLKGTCLNCMSFKKNTSDQTVSKDTHVCGICDQEFTMSRIGHGGMTVRPTTCHHCSKAICPHCAAKLNLHVDDRKLPSCGKHQ